MVRHHGGSRNLEAVGAFYSRLLVKGWRLTEITENVSKTGGSGALLRLLDSGCSLFNAEQLMNDFGLYRFEFTPPPGSEALLSHGMFGGFATDDAGVSQIPDLRGR